MSQLQPAPEEHLYARIATILDDARSRVARSINTAMVHAYWLIGREIVEVDQRGAERAGYGESLMKRVAARRSSRFGRGFSLASLKRMKQFYLAFPRGSALVAAGGGKGATALRLSAEADGGEKGSVAVSLSAGVSPLFPPTLAWSHYLVLLRVDVDALLERTGVMSISDAASRATVLAAMKKAAESRVAGVTEQKRRRHYGHAAELVATCVACDKTSETTRWAVARQAEYKRFPALRDKLDRALRSP